MRTYLSYQPALWHQEVNMTEFSGCGLFCCFNVGHKKEQKTEKVPISWNDGVEVMITEQVSRATMT